MSDRVSELLVQLKKLSPMPEDDLLTEEMLDAYGEIIDELREFIDPRSIEPLIASFGYGDGFGVYWKTLQLLEQFDDEQVAPHLIAALRHGAPGARMWAAFMLGRSRNKQAIPDLIKCLHDDKEYVRVNSILALGMIGDPIIKHNIEKLRVDPSEDVQHAVEVALSRMRDIGY